MTIDTSRRKGDVVTNFIWKLLERGLSQIVTLFVTIVLARILNPSDYALIAMVTVFITIADCFVTGGLSAALVQKNDAQSVDFSSMLYFSVLFGMCLYLLLFAFAPSIALFYDEDILCPILRVLALRLPLSAFYSIQSAYVSRTMQFSKFFVSTFIGTVLSAIIGIVLAYNDYGVWALVAQNLSNICFNTLILFIVIPWRPALEFSFNRLRQLVNFSFRLMLAEVLNAIYNELRTLLVGKIYTTNDLAYYHQGEKYPKFIVNILHGTIAAVVFPSLASVQDDHTKLKRYTRRAISLSMYVMAPLMIGFAAVAPSVIVILLTDKWSPCIPFLQIACFCQMLLPVQSTNLQAINALGRSDLYFRMEIIKKIFGVLCILFTIRLGVIPLAISSIFHTLFATLVNIYPNRKLLSYSFKEQMTDILPSIFVGLIMFFGIYWVNYLMIGNWIKIIIQVLLGATIYVSLSFIFKIPSFFELIDVVKRLVNRKMFQL